MEDDLDLDLDDEAFAEELEEIDEVIFDQIGPIIDALQSQYPQQNIWAVLFEHALYEMFTDGMTVEEVIEGIEEIHSMMEEDTMMIPPDQLLH